MKSIILCLLLIGCTKQSQQVISSNSVDNGRVAPVATFLSACFDGTNYNVRYELKNIKQDDIILGGCKIKHTEDTLSKIQLMAKNGVGEFVAGTGESGAGAKIYIKIIGAKGADWNFYIDGVKVGCK